MSCARCSHPSTASSESPNLGRLSDTRFSSIMLPRGLLETRCPVRLPSTKVAMAPSARRSWRFHSVLSTYVPDRGGIWPKTHGANPNHDSKFAPSQATIAWKPLIPLKSRESLHLSGQDPILDMKPFAAVVTMANDYRTSSPRAHVSHTPAILMISLSLR